MRKMIFILLYKNFCLNLGAKQDAIRVLFVLHLKRDVKLYVKIIIFKTFLLGEHNKTDFVTVIII